MPPRTMFNERKRPSGLEFAACIDCNRITSPADAVASYFARLERNSTEEQRKEIKQRGDALRRSVPGVVEELANDRNVKSVFTKSSNGLLVPSVQIIASGPLTRAYLNVFSSKLGMALFREHVGIPLPKGGKVYSCFYLNAGLAQKQADVILSILPALGTLRQGTFVVDKQFAYRFNSDERTTAAALASFHKGLHILTVCTSEPDKYLSSFQISGPTEIIVELGQLKTMMPVI